jgi:hypothetical protein
MADGFTIKIDGLERLNRVLDQLPRNVKSGVQQILHENGHDWMNKARADVPVDRALLKNSISFNVQATTLQIIAQNDTAAYQEFGTKSHVDAPAILGDYPNQFRGSSGRGGDPILALTEWVRRKGFAANYSIRTHRRTRRTKNESVLEKSIAYRVYRKIKKEGIKPRPFLFRSRNGEDRITYYYNRIKQDIADLLQSIVKR